MDSSLPWNRTFLIATLVLEGCASQPGSPGHEAPAVDATKPDASAAMDAAEPDASDSPHLSWSNAKATPRNHHLTALAETSAGPFLYVIGGVQDGRPTNTGERARIRDDGSLEAWQAVRAMPEARGGLTGGIVANTVVVAGGTGSGGVTDASYYATIDAEGNLGEWKAGGPMLHPRMHAGAFVRGNDIYVVGGFHHPEAWDDIVRASVQADGTLSAWQPAGKLRGPRTHQSITLVDDYVYVVGGLDQSPYMLPPHLDEVVRGHLSAGGTVDDWTVMPSLPIGLATHASFTYRGYLYVAGGIVNPPPDQERRVWRARIGDDHGLGAWEETTPLPLARGHVHQIPVFGNHAYSVSGAIDFDLNSTDTVAIGTFL